MELDNELQSVKYDVIACSIHTLYSYGKGDQQLYVYVL